MAAARASVAADRFYLTEYNVGCCLGYPLHDAPAAALLGPGFGLGFGFGFGFRLGVGVGLELGYRHLVSEAVRVPLRAGWALALKLRAAVGGVVVR